MIRVHEYGGWVWLVLISVIRFGCRVWSLVSVGIDSGDPVRLSGMEFGFGWYSFGDHLFSTTSTEQEGKPALLHLRLARNIALRVNLPRLSG
ncbi:hypothetical protein [Yersinia alsatica]|uniref:hypothetical protein n=1 Tax=Yersinia alsatica TaxID=2890317 RepID=UPI0011A8D957|nr:hypothetical protein [Yersinia alsatica]